MTTWTSTAERPPASATNGARTGSTRPQLVQAREADEKVGIEKAKRARCDRLGGSVERHGQHARPPEPVDLARVDASLEQPERPPVLDETAHGLAGGMVRHVEGPGVGSGHGRPAEPVLELIPEEGRGGAERVQPGTARVEQEPLIVQDMQAQARRRAEGAPTPLPALLQQEAPRSGHAFPGISEEPTQDEQEERGRQAQEAHQRRAAATGPAAERRVVPARPHGEGQEAEIGPEPVAGALPQSRLTEHFPQRHEVRNALLVGRPQIREQSVPRPLRPPVGGKKLAGLGRQVDSPGVGCEQQSQRRHAQRPGPPGQAVKIRPVEVGVATKEVDGIGEVSEPQAGIVLDDVERREQQQPLRGGCRDEGAVDPDVRPPIPQLVEIEREGHVLGDHVPVKIHDRQIRRPHEVDLAKLGVHLRAALVAALHEEARGRLHVRLRHQQIDIERASVGQMSVGYGADDATLEGDGANARAAEQAEKGAELPRLAAIGAEGLLDGAEPARDAGTQKLRASTARSRCEKDVEAVLPRLAFDSQPVLKATGKAPFRNPPIT